MPEYISREAALDAQNKSMNLAECRKRLEKLPAADVVEVVRCGECVHCCGVSGEPPFEEAYEAYCGEHDWCVSETYFCADGERKDGGQDKAPAGPYDLLYEEGGENLR